MPTAHESGIEKAARMSVMGGATVMIFDSGRPWGDDPTLRAVSNRRWTLPVFHRWKSFFAPAACGFYPM